MGGNPAQRLAPLLATSSSLASAEHKQGGSYPYASFSRLKYSYCTVCHLIADLSCVITVYVDLTKHQDLLCFFHYTYSLRGAVEGRLLSLTTRLGLLF